MWYVWITLLLVSCALVEAEVERESESGSVATTRAPPRTLDRKAAELAWRTWLQSPESGNQNAPPRRITTKSLFITPLHCPTGQRLDRNGCVQVVTVNKDDHERTLLEQLNALFTSSPNGDIQYDYSEEEPGPYQLSIPIGLDPQAAPLQAQEPFAQAQHSGDINIDKKHENKPDPQATLEAELELLKLQNKNSPGQGTGVLNHNVLNNFLPYSDKPKRNSPTNETDNNSTGSGQKELIYGQVNVDPVVYDTEYQNQLGSAPHNNKKTENVKPEDIALSQSNKTVNGTKELIDSATANSSDPDPVMTKESTSTKSPELKTDNDQDKLNPAIEYSDIGKAIKLISRYAEVSTDDNFSKEQKKYPVNEDSILGTRTKLQHRRNKTKQMEPITGKQAVSDDKVSIHLYPKNELYYRYPWTSHQSQTPPPGYPFRHLQDYWPGRTLVGGVYNTLHGNPTRHHHSYNYFRPHVFQRGYLGKDKNSDMPDTYSGHTIQNYPYETYQKRNHPRTNNQDLYTLLGLRHWFSSEGASKR